ncbi:hypothetical protein BJ875DRAFT_487724 [Amylocarpus encephaloides]|uniref:Uncharacterized protein n=1 Tax=Amylocarpus encephaloides TaxID=45428 RepID=A0A9P8C267_9HELO|nr:hypothetical protein BJ875DRAFT_487724 [Amylocarpus encephaloides]
MDNLRAAFPGEARRGVSHQYTSRLFAFEHTPQTPLTPPQNLVIFVGGLFDGLHTVPYTSIVADALPPTWTIAQAIISSSYTGWGTCSLQKDVKELSRCVAYFRKIKSGKIVLMGHSTGCQDVLEYLTGEGRESRAPIDGGIIQAAVSDREALGISHDAETLAESCVVAQRMVDDGDEDEMMSSTDIDGAFPCPVSAKRWLSLVSPNHDGDDDMFSSDLTDKQLMKTFGSLPASTPLCILLSGDDEFFSSNLGMDQKAILERWVGIVERGEGVVDVENSGVVEGATHNLLHNPEEVVEGLVRRVVGFLSGLLPQANL